MAKSVDARDSKSRSARRVGSIPTRAPAGARPLRSRRSPSPHRDPPSQPHASAAPGHPGPAADQRRAVLPGLFLGPWFRACSRCGRSARTSCPGRCDLRLPARRVEHLFFNMLGLWMFGAELERVWGRGASSSSGSRACWPPPLTQLLVALVIGRSIRPSAPRAACSACCWPSAMLFPNRIIVLLIPPIPMSARNFVDLFGAIELVLGFYAPQRRRGPLRAPGRHARRLADDPLLARPAALRPATLAPVPFHGPQSPRQALGRVAGPCSGARPTRGAWRGAMPDAPASGSAARPSARPSRHDLLRLRFPRRRPVTALAATVATSYCRDRCIASYRSAQATSSSWSSRTSGP